MMTEYTVSVSWYLLNHRHLDTSKLMRHIYHTLHLYMFTKSSFTQVTCQIMYHPLTLAFRETFYASAPTVHQLKRLEASSLLVVCLF